MQQFPCGHCIITSPGWPCPGPLPDPRSIIDLGSRVVAEATKLGTKNENKDVIDSEEFPQKDFEDEAQEESGLEIISRGTLEDSYIEKGNDTMMSDRTDSLLRGSTLVESFTSERTISSHTLEAEIPSDGDEGETEAESPLQRRKEQLTILAKNVMAETQMEVLMTQVSQVAKDIKAEVKELKPDLTPTPESKEMPTPMLEMKNILATHQEDQEEADLDGTKAELLEHATASKISPEDKDLENLGIVEISVKDVNAAEPRSDKEAAGVAVQSSSIIHHQVEDLGTVSLDDILGEALKSTKPKSSATPISDLKRDTEEVKTKVEMSPILSWTSGSIDSSAAHTIHESTSIQTSRHGAELQKGASWLSDVLEESTTSSEGSKPSRESSYVLSSSPRVLASTTSSSYERSGTQSSIESTSKGSETSGAPQGSVHTSTSQSRASEDKSPVTTQASGSEREAESSTPSTSDRDSVDLAQESSPSPAGLSKSTNQEADMSVMSLPSSPKREKAAVKTQLTSELFSADSDIASSLELVYKEPSEDPRQQISERYRHSSSSGSNSDDGKMEKRKASVTQLKKHEDSSDRASSEEDALQFPQQHLQKLEEVASPSPIQPSSDSSYEVVTMTKVTTTTTTTERAVSPPSGKKTPSPTKIKQPCVVTASEREQVSQEIISPVLEVRVQTPESHRESRDSDEESAEGGGLCYT